jgi:hypothetical protein
MLPPVPNVTLVFPAATVAPPAVENAGHEMSKTPDAGLPWARNTVSLMVVSAGVCDLSGATASAINSAKQKSRHCGRLACVIIPPNLEVGRKR